MTSRKTTHRSSDIASHRPTARAGERSGMVEAFRARAEAAIELAAASAGSALLTRALSASTDFETVLIALSDPKVLRDAARPRLDPLIAARERGARAMFELMNAEGGCLSVGQLSELYKLSPQAINKRRQSGSCLAIRLGRNDYFYPIWQFTADGTPLSGLKDVLAAFTVSDAWMRLNFFLTPEVRLDGRRPLDALRSQDIDAVIAAAAAFGEHGAP